MRAKLCYLVVVVLLAGIGLWFIGCSSVKPITLTILHTNDSEGYVDPCG